MLRYSDFLRGGGGGYLKNLLLGYIILYRFHQGNLTVSGAWSVVSFREYFSKIYYDHLSMLCMEGHTIILMSNWIMIKGVIK